jgi:hypothetical protein
MHLTHLLSENLKPGMEFMTHKFGIRRQVRFTVSQSEMIPGRLDRTGFGEQFLVLGFGYSIGEARGMAERTLGRMKVLKQAEPIAIPQDQFVCDGVHRGATCNDPDCWQLDPAKILRGIAGL